MAYREVTVIEVKEVLRLWLRKVPKKHIAAELGLDPKTVRRYVATATAVAGLTLEQGEAALTEERLAAVVLALRVSPEREHGEAWRRCVEQRDFLAALLKQNVRLTKARKLLKRKRGVDVPYSTLHRFATAELDFGSAAPSMPVADCEPGEEVQVDTGWVGWIHEEGGQRRRFRAWIFTSVFSRHRFVWPCFRETTETAIEACEAAWEFFGGVFRVLIPDNTKVIVARADPLYPHLNLAFLEYAQARGFEVDPARARTPTDKARVERSVPHVRDDCFGGELLRSVEAARAHALQWCRDDYGMRRHTRTRRLPRECFEAEERSKLRPAPQGPYDVPVWSEPKIGGDQYAQVALALYSLPRQFVGKTLRARADKSTVRFYQGPVLVRVHPRAAPGERKTAPSDFPAERLACAQRDSAFVEARAAEHGQAIAGFAKILLAGPLPWTRMRRAYALLGLVKRFGATRVDEACGRALAADMHDVKRLERMLAIATPIATTSPTPTLTDTTGATTSNGAVARVLLAGTPRFLRPASEYMLAGVSRVDSTKVEVNGGF